MKKNENKSYRINLELGPKSFKALNNLQTATEARSKVETIRLALQITEKLVQETQAGGRVAIQRKDGQEMEIYLPLVSN